MRLTTNVSGLLCKASSALSPICGSARRALCDRMPREPGRRKHWLVMMTMTAIML
jgi:hypothetical protein